MEINYVSLIEQSWKKEQLPIINGIVKSNGLYYPVENILEYTGTAESAPFSFDFSKGYFSSVMSTGELIIDRYTLYFGEGSFGGDGFIYIEETKSKKLFWCLLHDEMNPIVKCSMADNNLIADNNNCFQFTFDFQNPERF